ncbi:hypothetical protein MRX96_045938 [Rhipicephalus microplus]
MVLEGAIDQCLDDLANTDKMETVEGLQHDATTIDDPVCTNWLVTLSQEAVIRDDTMYFDISPVKTSPHKACCTTSTQNNSRSRRSTSGTPSASAPTYTQLFLTWQPVNSPH